MIEGIRKERLEELLKISKRRYVDNWSTAQTSMIEGILEECTELDSWIPIDENTPKDRSILLLWPQEIGGAMQGYWICDAWYCDMWELTGSLMSKQPTHYKLSPEDPK